MAFHTEEGPVMPVKVHHPIPPSLITNRSTLQLRASLPEEPSLQEALNLPSRDVSDRLVQSFFSTFHPAYPVIDRRSFSALYDQGQVSALVLHAIYMVALTCGSEQLVALAGYDDRTTARTTHYLRAKKIYDVDHETNDANVAAALHLLSFWWLGPDDRKDSWYWQGCSVTLAQSLGAHRS